MLLIIGYTHAQNTCSFLLFTTPHFLLTAPHFLMSYLCKGLIFKPVVSRLHQFRSVSTGLKRLLDLTISFTPHYSSLHIFGATPKCATSLIPPPPPPPPHSSSSSSSSSSFLLLLLLLLTTQLLPHFCLPC